MISGISGKNVTVQTLILVVLLVLLLISRVSFQNVLFESSLIVIILCSVIAVFYFHRERATAAARKASSSIAHSKYARHIEGEVGHTDEVLADVILDVAESFRALNKSFESIESYSREVHNKSTQLSLGTEAQTFSLEETSTSIEGISSSIIKLVGLVETLFPRAEKATSSILDMVDSNKMISGSTQELLTQVRSVYSHIDGMVLSVGEMQKRFSDLMSSSEDTSMAVGRIDSTIKEIEDKAVASTELSEQVKSDAEVGAAAASKTIEGMSRIKEIVTESAEVIQRLGVKSKEIGDIINVINEITDRTNLLALNASIIAAQAGEYGKGFAVVADEIKRLAEQTAQSTVEISGHIGGIQSMVEDVVQANEMGKWSAEDGVRLSIEAGDALRKILESTGKSSEMSMHIAEATVNQSKETKLVLSSIKGEVGFIQEVASVMDEHAERSNKIKDAANRMLDITQDVAKANMEQEKANAYVTKVVEEVKEMVKGMYDITRTQKNDSDQILQAIEIIGYISSENIKGIKDLADGAEELRGLIGKFGAEFKDAAL